MDQETAAEYIPEPGDRVKWWKALKSNGTSRGVVDHIVSFENKTCMVYVPPTNTNRWNSSPPKYKKRFDQLELLERPVSDREA